MTQAMPGRCSVPLTGPISLPGPLRITLAAIILLTGAFGCQRTEPHEPLPVSAEVGEGLYALRRCSTCHAIDGSGGRIGCDLSRVARRREKDWIVRWLRDPQAVRPGTRMPDMGLSEEEALAIAEYLATRR